MKLKRRRHCRDPQRRFILYCEGRNTEPAYFAAIGRRYASAQIVIEAIGVGGVPFTVAERAVNRAKEERLVKRRRREANSFEEDDQVWAVFDRDEHPRFEDAVMLCGRHGVGVARSDPCFELWLILHLEDRDRPDDRRAVQSRLRRLRPDYDPRGAKTLNCDDLMAGVEAAETRGRWLLQRRQQEGDPHGNPSTTVGCLTCAIREADKRASPTLGQ